MVNTLVWMRRRNASSASVCGYKFVENTTISSKGTWNLSPEDNVQEINPPVERHGPAVEQVFRGKHLAAEIVDDQNAVIGLHLAR